MAIARVMMRHGQLAVSELTDEYWSYCLPEADWTRSMAGLCRNAMAFDPSFELVKSISVLLDKHYMGARYPSSLPGGVPAEAYDAADSERALEIAGDVLEAVQGKL